MALGDEGLMRALYIAAALMPGLQHVLGGMRG
jgi:hypothetical protein